MGVGLLAPNNTPVVGVITTPDRTFIEQLMANVIRS